MTDETTSLAEYCAWFYNAEALEDIFGLSSSDVLPKIRDVIEYELEVGRYPTDDLEFLPHVLETKGESSPSEFKLVINDLANEALEKLGIETSFPSIRQSAKTICRWIISQENFITKNLDRQQRLAVLDEATDYHNICSIFLPLTRVFRDRDFETSASDNRNLHYFYFSSWFGGHDSPDQGSLREQLKKQSVPDEYQSIFDHLFNFYCDNVTVEGWINNEGEIVELAKQCYKTLSK